MEKETMEIDVDLTDLMFDLENYVPTREGGYIFRGWYKEPECKTLAIPGEYLTNENTKDRKFTDQPNSTVTPEVTVKLGMVNN